jgi:hypothetical protein
MPLREEQDSGKMRRKEITGRGVMLFLLEEQKETGLRCRAQFRRIGWLMCC